jgi:hypothetical protein
MMRVAETRSANEAAALSVHWRISGADERPLVNRPNGAVLMWWRVQPIALARQTRITQIARRIR